jgi:hypothetical protein
MTDSMLLSMQLSECRFFFSQGRADGYEGKEMSTVFLFASAMRHGVPSLPVRVVRCNRSGKGTHPNPGHSCRQIKSVGDWA